jgi:hypothetical protein
MIVTFLYKNKNSNTKYYGKFIGYIKNSYEEGLDKEIVYLIYDIVKDYLNLLSIEDLIVGVLGFNRGEGTDYFSENEAYIFDLLLCNWPKDQKEIYLNGKLLN